VCRSSIASGLLILVFATSAFGCATGCGSESLGFCPGGHSQRLCSPSKARAAEHKSSSCGHLLKSSRGQCSLRSLAQFQFAELRDFETSSPLQRASGKASPVINSRIVILSVGSPETDRGPPHS
jgi:hypothetical protein